MATTPISQSEATYSMNSVARMTGLTPDTIRVWERRYKAVEPARTQGGTRRYTAQDVQRLVLIKEAADKGHSLAEASKLETEALVQLLRKQEAPGAAQPGPARTLSALLSEYLEHVERFRVFEASRLLSRAAAVMEPRDFVKDVVVPLLTDVGLRWETGRFLVVHEHIISEQVRHLLYGIQYRRDTIPGAPMVLVATPEGHRHEFGAVIGTYVAAAQGLKCIYLGSEVPWLDLAVAAENMHASVVVLSIVRSMDLSELEALRRGLGLLTQHCPVWIGAPKHMPEMGLANIRVFRSFEEFDLALHALLR